MSFLNPRRSNPEPTISYEAPPVDRVPLLDFEAFLALDELRATEVASATASAIQRAAQALHE